MTTTAKCTCNVCSGYIEFDPARAGETLSCPHCKMETLLFLPPGQLAKVSFEPAPVARLSGDDAPTDATFLSRQGLLVTKTRLVVGEQLFSLANISSVRLGHIAPNRTPPLMLLFLPSPIFWSIDPDLALFVGTPLAVLALIWLCLQKPIFALIISAAGGEQTALLSPDRRTAGEVVSAVNAAIVARG
jgi:hypothetical protein